MTKINIEGTKLTYDILKVILARTTVTCRKPVYGLVYTDTNTMLFDAQQIIIASSKSDV